MTLPIPVLGGTTLVADQTYSAQWASVLRDADVYLLEADLAGIEGEQGFFDVLRHALALPEGDVLSNWDGFSDDLWTSVASSTGDAGVIVLRNVDALAAADLGALLEAVDVVRSVARRAAQGVPREVELYLVLTGAGPSFR